MPATIISLTSDVLDAHLITLEGQAQELNSIASEVLTMTFGSSGGNESAGPCSGKSNEINQELHNSCVDISSVIEKSVMHLRKIQNDIIASQGGS